MGANQLSKINSKSINKSKIRIQKDNWLLLQKNQSNANELGNYIIYKNKITGEVARQYSLQFTNKKQYQQYIEEFDSWRSHDQQNILSSKYIVFQQNNNGFGFDQLCSNFFMVKIFVENPVITLSQIKDIPPAQSFYILLSALVGYQYLFSIFGYFQIRQSMILINEPGQVKVWIHPDLSKNRPISHNINNIQVNQKKNPSQFIKQLISIIDNNTDYGEISVSFKQHIQQKYDNEKLLSFHRCRKQVLSYAQHLKMDIPQSLINILDLLFEKTNESSISNDNIQTNHILYGKNYNNEYLIESNNRNVNYSNINSNNHLEYQQHQHSNHESYQQEQSYHEKVSKQHPELNKNMSCDIQSFHQYSRTQSINQFNHNHPNIQFNYQSSSHSSNNQSRHNTYNQSRQNSYLSLDQVHNSHHNHHGNQLSSNHNFNQSQIQQKLVIYSDQPQYLNQQHANQIPLYINSPYLQSFHNPHLSLVQKQSFHKQSIIRQEPEEDSFLTSYRNSKFQTSSDIKQPGNFLKKNYKNIQTHRHTFSSQSDSRLNTQNIQNYSPRQVQIRQQKNQRSKLQSQQIIKQSQKSIKFYTPNQTKQLDLQIARDLQMLINSIKN